MKSLFASGSFKGTLSSERITTLLEESAGRIFPGCEAAGVFVADGGKGAIDAMISVLNGAYRRLMVHGPLTEECESSHGEFEGDSATIEMAATSGLPTVPAEKRNLLNTTTYGIGELTRDALDRGYRKVSIAIDSSTTSDGGMGVIRALGIKFLDDQGNELEGKGEDLTKVTDIVASGLRHDVVQARFTVMCGVTNPLTGPDGTTYTFGKQKDGTLGILDIMEGGMIRYAAPIKEKLGVDVDGIPGSGAAGGLGATLCVFLRTDLKSGADTVLDLVRFSESLEGVDLVVTGEGRMDWQSASGKMSSGIGQWYKERGILVVAIIGGMGHKAEAIFDHGVNSIMTTINEVVEPEEALDRSKELYVSATDRMFRMLKAGMSLR